MSVFKLESFLPYKLSILSQTVSRLIAQDYESRFGLTMNQWRCIVIIGNHEAITAKHICDLALLDKMTVSRAIRTLEARKLIKLSASPKDARKRLIYLTPIGRKIRTDVLPVAQNYERKLLGALSNSEIQALDSITEKLMTAANTLQTGN